MTYFAIVDTTRVPAITASARTASTRRPVLKNQAATPIATTTPTTGCAQSVATSARTVARPVRWVEIRSWNRMPASVAASEDATAPMVTGCAFVNEVREQADRAECHDEPPRTHCGPRRCGEGVGSGHR